MATYTFSLPLIDSKPIGLFYRLGLKIPSSETITQIVIGTTTEKVGFERNITMSYGYKACIFLARHDFDTSSIDWSQSEPCGEDYRALSYCDRTSNVDTWLTYNQPIKKTSNLSQFSGEIVDLMFYGIIYTNSERTTWRLMDVGDMSATFNDAYEMTITTEKRKSSVTVSTTTGGTVTDVSGSYDIESIINLSATPSTGYKFNRWIASDGIVADIFSPTTTFIVPIKSSATVTAYFDAISSAPSQAGRYNGTSWDGVIPMRYDGTNWVECEYQRYNGSSWDNVDTN